MNFFQTLLTDSWEFTKLSNDCSQSFDNLLWRIKC